MDQSLNEMAAWAMSYLDQRLAQRDEGRKARLRISQEQFYWLARFEERVGGQLYTVMSAGRSQSEALIRLVMHLEKEALD